MTFVGLFLLATQGILLAAERPNILWISCEDIGPHLGCYGDPTSQTPTLDKLASDSIRYTRTFSVAPVCAPSRSSIITGQYPTTIGSHHMRSKAKLAEENKCFTEYLRDAGYYCTNNVKTDYNFPTPAAAWDESSDTAHWRDREGDQPFFAVFNFTNTHESKVWPRDEEHLRLTPDVKPTERQDPKNVQLPPYYPDTPEVRRDWANYLENITQLDYNVAKLLAELDEAGLADDTIVFFWSDHGAGLPRGKRWLYDSGQRVPLMVYMPAKWAEKFQSPAKVTNDELVSLIDLAPTVLSLCDLDVPEQLQGQAFLGNNLKPSRHYVFGVRDRMDERYDIFRSVRDKRYRYVRNYYPWKPYAQHVSYGDVSKTMQAWRKAAADGTVPEAGQLFMAKAKPVEELYDLESDPYEVHNLANSTDAEHQAKLKELRTALTDWEVESGDLGLIPEPLVRSLERKAGSGSAILDDPKLVASLGRVREMLSPAITDSERNRLINDALNAGAPVERYWAALLLGHSSELNDEVVEKLKTLLSDSTSPVRIAAAEGLLVHGYEEQAVPVLASEMQSGSQWSRLMAVNSLDLLTTKNSDASAAFERALSDENQQVKWVAKGHLHRVDGKGELKRKARRSSPSALRLPPLSS